MSQGYITVKIDYVCSVAPYSYDYYLGVDDSDYDMENTLFNNAVSEKKDYNGITKNFIFDTFNLKVNAFAGNTGDWSTYVSRQQGNSN